MSLVAPGAEATAGQIYEESVRQLARWRDRYRGRPDRERRRLWLLALEREQVVSIAYRESAIADRIARMPLAEEVRDLIRHAMVWVWKDEEMHTAYIRGVVLHRGDPVLQAVAYGEQVVGAVSGWAAAVEQHTQFRDAPVSVALASVLALGGRVDGQAHEGAPHRARVRARSAGSAPSTSSSSAAPSCAGRGWSTWPRATRSAKSSRRCATTRPATDRSSRSSRTRWARTTGCDRA